ncbi:MAG: N-acetyltransferase [Thiovulaceae bacterium]|nr:N-acetyltransferase [Sulfurimonadaceae bacterium]
MIDFVKATLKDIPSMQELVLPYIIDGTILERTNDEVATNIRSYILAKDEGKLVGFLALHIHNDKLAEIRSLIVDEAYREKSIGKTLIQEAVSEGERLAVNEVLVLTYRWEIFAKSGFVEIPKESLPDHKIWADCIKCKHFPVCNEVSLIKKLAN